MDSSIITIAEYIRILTINHYNELSGKSIVAKDVASFIHPSTIISDKIIKMEAVLPSLLSDDSDGFYRCFTESVEELQRKLFGGGIAIIDGFDIEYSGRIKYCLNGDDLCIDIGNGWQLFNKV